MKSLTAGLLNALADFICQVFYKSAKEERVLFFCEVQCRLDLNCEDCSGPHTQSCDLLVLSVKAVPDQPRYLEFF